jgi:hypothetical protein
MSEPTCIVAALLTDRAHALAEDVLVGGNRKVRPGIKITGL